MKIAVVGTGYVGLVTGACFADSGNDVICVDIDATKVERLNVGQIPIYEPGLSEIVARCRRMGRIHFTTQIAEAAKDADLVFLAVGTPQSKEGKADLKYVWAAVEQLAPHLPKDAIVVMKSTVPVGTNKELHRRLRELTGREVETCSNPEFLKEGAAIDDFTKPDRVVIGVRSERAAEVMKNLYAPFLRTDNPCLVMAPESAEMTKYVANCLLAAKISFINEMSNYCEAVGADVNDVRRGIGHDHRIGFQFLHPGVGYGGSCFPKDVRALQATAEQHGCHTGLLEEIDRVNDRQKQVIPNKIEKHFGDKLAGKTIAVWGLAFKPRTDDVREASALVLLDRMLEKGAKVRVHDPEAMPNIRQQYGDKLIYCEDPYAALDGASALAIMTEWNEFRQPDFDEVKKRMKEPTIFDGRNLYALDVMREAGFTYHSIGRSPVKQGG
ncbi:MAG TPA: UDP-glucose/GDP-mannose dehydrogenase family protein [Pirellulales bacterium]